MPADSASYIDCNLIRTTIDAARAAAKLGFDDFASRFMAHALHQVGVLDGRVAELKTEQTETIVMRRMREPEAA